MLDSGRESIVLNAFRHLRMIHNQRTSLAGVMRLVLNAFRHLRMIHSSDRDNATEGGLVLNAFRHLRMIHLFAKKNREGACMCSTPFGIFE